jgi:hypothetical protein
LAAKFSQAGLNTLSDDALDAINVGGDRGNDVTVDERPALTRTRSLTGEGT